jgi:hypothetical protein
MCSNVCQPHGSIFSYMIHNVVHILNVKLRVQTMICKERCLLCCCKQSPLWTKGLTNYIDDNWLCDANIVPKLD